MKNILFFTLALFALILSSCTTAYIPTEVNAPAFSEPNQFKSGISYGSSGTNLELGYSFYKNFAAIGDISYLRVRGTSPRLQRQWGFGLGYFKRIHNNDSVYMEVFAGFSSASTFSSYEDDEFTNGPGFENADYYRIYIQPDISFHYEFVDLIFAIRINYFNFTRYEYYLVANPGLPRAIGIEPVFKVRLGSEYVKLKYQIGLSLTETLTKYEFNYEKAFTNFGLEFSF
ncbi:MAG TPA: hypothetical protein VGK25_02635 [Ignavibacteria bacterium]